MKPQHRKIYSEKQPVDLENVMHPGSRFLFMEDMGTRAESQFSRKNFRGEDHHWCASPPK